jgi:hypothetical protein
VTLKEEKHAAGPSLTAGSRSRSRSRSSHPPAMVRGGRACAWALAALCVAGLVAAQQGPPLCVNGSVTERVTASGCINARWTGSGAGFVGAFACGWLLQPSPAASRVQLRVTFFSSSV